MKKLVVALALVLGVLVVNIPPALAARHVETCGTWQHVVINGTASAQVCVSVNESEVTSANEGLVRYRLTGATTGGFRLEIDYIRLLANGQVVRSAETNFTDDFDGTYQSRSTGWFTNCVVSGDSSPTYKTTARYRITHKSDGHTSGWVTRTTGGWTDSYCF
jgi:hypothetical protein